MLGTCAAAVRPATSGSAARGRGSVQGLACALADPELVRHKPPRQNGQPANGLEVFLPSRVPGFRTLGGSLEAGLSDLSLGLVSTAHDRFRGLLATADPVFPWSLGTWRIRSRLSELVKVLLSCAHKCLGVGPVPWSLGGHHICPAVT